MTLLSCWILITLLNFDFFLSHNSTGRRFVGGSDIHVELWPQVKIQRWFVTSGQNSTLNYDPQVRIPHWIMIPILDHNLTLNYDLGSQFNVEFRPRVIIERGNKTRGHNSTWNHDLCKILTWNDDPGLDSTLNYDTGSEFNIELWSQTRVTI